jgi:hypothetical protein
MSTAGKVSWRVDAARDSASQRWNWMRESCSAQEKEVTKPPLRRAGSNIGVLQRPGRPLCKRPQRPESPQLCIYEGIIKSSRIAIPSVVSFARDLARHRALSFMRTPKDRPGVCVWRYQAMHLRFGVSFSSTNELASKVQEASEAIATAKMRGPMSKKNHGLSARPWALCATLLYCASLSARSLNNKSSTPVPAWRP